MEFKLTEEYIELISLLKFLRLAESGGHAKIMVEEGLIIRNGEKEFRKRAKIRAGDMLDVDGTLIRITD